MPGKWKVTANYINDRMIYAVYRLRDTSEIDHSGNREYGSGWFSDSEEAQKIADKLNEEEAEHER